MTNLEATALGVIQGLTEFLPISSSGHLVLIQRFLQLKAGLLFNISVHLGSMLAIIIFFRRDLVRILKGIDIRNLKDNVQTRMLWFILVGSIPTALIGLIYKKKFIHLLDHIPLVGLMFILTGTLLWLSDRVRFENKGILRMKASDALLIGLMQGIAVMPGISRSGSTIAIGMFCGLKRELAMRFSFLLFLPAIFGAMLLQLGDLKEGIGSIGLVSLILGTCVSFLSSWLALHLLWGILKRRKLRIFSYYCWILSLFVLWGYFK